MKPHALAGMVLLGALAAARGQDGIYADFTTSMGAFTVQLDYVRAPRAVASFVGLATGEKAWADPEGRVWQKPFYDGTLFHRVVKGTNGMGIAIQGGGVSYSILGYTNLPAGPAESDGQSFIAITTNPPGITTNDFLRGMVPFTTMNPAAVSTSYHYCGELVTTTAAAVTRTVIQLVQSSSNSSKYVFNSYVAESFYTNHLLQAVETTNYGTIFTVTTNTGSSPEVLVHRGQLAMATTTTIRGPVVSTNFANAGYYMLDSATNGLSHSNGVISMANSGPNTDGSQFFITATNYPAWNGSYTVFGRVTTGMSVVAAIAAVAVQGAGERPVADVVLSNVVIRRVGAATNFNIATQGIPAVESASLGVKATGSAARVTVQIPAYSECHFRVATNLCGPWKAEDWGYFSNGTTQLRQITTNTGSNAFFHVSSVSYPDPWTAPSSHAGRVFHFYWDTAPITHYRAAFTNAAGAWQKTQGTNNISGEIWGNPNAPNWSRLPYSARFFFADNLAQYYYILRFNPAQSTNRFTCTMSEWLSGKIFSISGTFTVE